MFAGVGLLLWFWGQFALFSLLPAHPPTAQELRGAPPDTSSKLSPAPPAALDRTTARGRESGHAIAQGPVVNLVVEVREPNGARLPVPASVRITGSEFSLQETAGVEERGFAVFRKLPAGQIHLSIAADGFAPLELNADISHGSQTRRVLVHLRTLDRNHAPGGSWEPALPTRDTALYSKVIELLRARKQAAAEKDFAKLLHRAPGHPDVNYLAGVIAYRNKDMNAAVNYFSTAAYLNPDAENATSALAGALYCGGQYGGALAAFSRLVQLQPDSWEAAWAAASAAYLAGSYERSREFALRAATHKVRFQPLLLAALADSQLQRWDESLHAAQEFLKLAGDSPLAGLAREIIASKDRPQNIILDTPPPVSSDQALPALISEDLLEPRLPARLWAPPEVDDSAPPLAPNIACPQQDVLQAASTEVQRMASGIGQVGANEQIMREELDGLGHGRNAMHLKGDYYAEIRPLPTGDLSVGEYRSRDLPEAEKGSAPVAHGLVAMALVFHPQFLNDFSFRCEGLTEWKGHNTWSIYFTERLDRPARLHVFAENGQFFPAYLKGRAMVDRDTSEVLHLETDLVEPIPAIRLDEEHLVVDYGPVNFRMTNQRFWLPGDADLYLHIDGRLYHVRHTLRDYITFKVDTREQLGAPKNAVPEAPAEPKPDRKPDSPAQGPARAETAAKPGNSNP